MIVLGVDPGSQATGYGVIRTGTTIGVLAGGVIRTGKNQLLPERLRIIHSEIQRVVNEHRPDVMVVENVFNARNAHSSLVLGHARGVILLAGAEANLPVAEYSPREVKLAVTGNGGSTKQQVRFMVMRLLGLVTQPPLDQSDALAIALTHISRGRIHNGLAAQAGGTT